jgi:ribonuclease P protein subunit RPR2
MNQESSSTTNNQSKKNKKKQKNGTTIPNLASFERMNFLYQASHLLMNVHLQLKAQDSAEAGIKTRSTVVDSLDLSRHYVQTMSKIASKSVLRLHPDLKRTFCKYCHTLLIPGETCQVRTANQRKQAHLVVTCLHCGKFCRYMLTHGNTGSVAEKKKTTTTTDSLLSNDQMEL